jgi:hypothetical protein
VRAKVQDRQRQRKKHRLESQMEALKKGQLKENYVFLPYQLRPYLFIKKNIETRLELLLNSSKNIFQTL